MAITLQQAKVGMADKVDQAVIDTFQRSSLLLDMLVFDDAVSPGTGGSTLTYGYLMLKTPATAAKREINGKYTPKEAVKEKKTADLKIIGGSFELDRVIIGTSGAVSELAFQMEEQVKATANLFHYLAINGKKATDGFDGLSELLKGQENEITSAVDISTSAKMDTNHNALLDELDKAIRLIDGPASLILVNTEMYTKLVGCARRAGYFTRSENAFGQQVGYYNGIPIMDVGKYYNGTKNDYSIPTTNGKTDIFIVRIGLNAFHGVSVNGSKLINTFYPYMNDAEEVKKGGVELIAAVVLKSSKAAAVVRGVQIGAAG